MKEEFPNLGASRHGLIYCDGHGKIVLETKCPLTDMD